MAVVRTAKRRTIPGGCGRTFAFRRSECRLFLPTRGSATTHVRNQRGTEQLAGLCHPDGGGVPFLHRLSGLATRFSAALRQPALWLDRESDRRQRALVRFRPVLCISISL